MKTPRMKRSRRRVAVAAAATGASWVALLAATSLGIGSVQRVRAAVSADPRQLAHSPDGYRLIVQSYARSSLTAGELPAQAARPMASTQRAITREELARGVAVDVLDVGSAPELSQDEPVIIAWVEQGHPDLDFDGFEARPAADAFYGIAVAHADELKPVSADVVLKKHVS
jgi:hypothetical protein